MPYDFEHLSQTHDLSLPAWGPYGKRFFGISHLTDQARGTRFDFTVMPGIYRRAIAFPDALRPSGYLPWNVTPDLNAYSYRQQLDDTGLLVCEVTFVAVDAHTRLVTSHFLNNSDLPVDCAAHLVASLVPNPVKMLEAEPGVEFFKPHLPSPRGLVYDAFFPYEERMDGTVGGTAYRIPANVPVPCPRILARDSVPCPRILAQGKRLWLRAAPQGKVTLTGEFGAITIEGDGNFHNYLIINELDNFNGFTADTDLLVDCLAVCEDEPQFVPAPTETLPEFTRGEQSMLLRYPGLATCYGARWSESETLVQRYAVDDFNHVLLYDDSVRQTHLSLKFFERGGSDCHIEAFFQPLRVEAHADRWLYAVIADGTPEKLPARLDAFDFACAPKLVREAETHFVTWPESPLRFSQERMASVLLSNVVYPTYFCGRNVRHHTPGRLWNSLYTWDSGFIGLGLLEIDTRRTVENLNAYLTMPGDPDNAFVHHGSPVPVQLYLLYELWNRTCDRELLAYFYPRAKQMYDYLAGHDERSTTLKHSKEPAVCTWDYFYNSGGWDDYPPQHFVHETNRLTAIPCVGTSHIIRCAKMLRSLAALLGEDTTEYDNDIQRFTETLQTYAWDEESGFFGYVDHDEEGTPIGILRHESGQNFNCGYDGAMPLVAGITTPTQEARLWAALQSPEHFWCRAGLSTVDMTAPYFRTDGYWNGSVWMPYQWFFWKTALDHAQADFAWRIAERALALWETEVQSSHACYEQFSISSGRGSGWHHFGGLSAPVLSWHAAYYVPGTITHGFDILRRSCQVNVDGLTAELEIGGREGDSATFIACLGGSSCTAEYNGSPCPVITRRPGVFEVTLPKATVGKLAILLEN
ncbi:MAG: hypothetical protein II943_05360 [Victivallales bacterium]|nr:hypothetical protein [Victivallales bacterium]